MGMSAKDLEDMKGSGKAAKKSMGQPSSLKIGGMKTTLRSPSFKLQ